MLIHIVAHSNGPNDIAFDAYFKNVKDFCLLLELLWDKGYDVLSKRIDDGVAKNVK